MNFLNVKRVKDKPPVIEEERAGDKTEREQFDRIYELAGLPSSGPKFTVPRLAALIQNSKYLRSQAPQTKSTAALVALEASNTTIDEIMEDASHRERSLDTYEGVQQKALEEFEARKSKQNRELQTELEAKIADYNTKIQTNTGDVARARASFVSWQGQKHQEVERLRETVNLCRLSSRTESTLEVTLDLIKSSRSLAQSAGR